MAAGGSASSTVSAAPVRPVDPCRPSAAACFQGAEALADKTPAAAMSALERCLTCSDPPPAAFRLLATLQEDAGAKDQAQATLRAGVRRYAESGLLWLALGRIELGRGHPKEGIEALGTAHRLLPSDVNLEQEYKDALARYGTDEDRAEAAIHALLLEAAGRGEISDYAGAEDALRAALAKLDHAPRLMSLVHHRLAMLWMRRGKPSEARVELDRALAHETGATELRAQILIAASENLLTLKKPEDAAKAATEAVQLEPKNVFAHANLAIARSLTNDREGAMRSLRDALSLGLPRRMTLDQFLALGPAIDRLKSHPDFTPLVRGAWPDTPYPPEPKKKR